MAPSAIKRTIASALPTTTMTGCVGDPMRRKISLRDYLFSTITLALVQAQTSALALKNAVNCNFSSQKFANAHFFS